MREIYIKNNVGLLNIGRRGENIATRVHLHRVQESGQYVTVYVMRNGDTVAYPASQVEVTDTEIIWTVTSIDTGKNGRGEVQYRFSDPVTGKVIKTEIYDFLVSHAIDTEVGPAPDPYETWLDSLTEIAGQVQTDAERAESEAARAEGYAESASSSAQSAGQSASLAGTHAANAHTSATSARQSAISAAASATSASQSAETASTKASEASSFAQTALAKATEASGYASTASIKASEASQSASTATQAKTDAESAKTASETAQGLAETARNEAVSAKAEAESARDEAQGVVDGITGKVEQIDSNTERIESLEDDRYKPYAVDTASGSIASFPDGADDLPLKSLIVDIDPIQDLHGYDYPWPAGGVANKLIENFANGILDSRGNFVPNNTNISSTEFSEVTPSAKYYFYCGSFPDAKAYIAGYDENKAFVDYIPNTAGVNSNRTLTIPSNVHFIKINMSSSYGTTYKNDIALNYPVTVTTYFPNANICPISGWDEVKVYDDPRYGGLVEWNQLAKFNSINIPSANKGITYSSTDGKSVTFNGTATRVESRTSWFNLSEGGGLSGKYGHIVLLLSKALSGEFSDGTVSVGLGGSDLQSIGTPIRTTLPRSGKLYIATVVSEGCICNDYTVTFNCCDLTEMFGSGNEPTTQLFLDYFPNIQDEYFPYNAGETMTVGQVNGEAYRAYTIEMPSEAGTVYGGTLDVTTGVLTVTDAQIASYAGETLPGEWISDRDVYVAGTTPTTGAQVVYKLATPQTYTLTATQFQTLLGTNNIWADTGNTEVEYRADTKLFIARLTEPDADMIADANIVSGQYFMVGNNLFKATANIASGSAIIVGTNAVRKSLSEALNEINA